MRGVLRGAAIALALMAGMPAGAQQADGRESVAAHESAAILVYSATAGFRHDSIPCSWSAIAGIAHDRGWSVTFTEDPAWFEAARLAQFDAVVFASATGDTLSEGQKAAFRSFVEHGGGFVGLHAAGDHTHVWDWYANELIGARFIGHPLDPGVRSGTIMIEDKAHPATRDLPPRWHRMDEWYSFDRSVRGRFHVLAALDERTYVPGQSVHGAELAMGDHPVVWNRCVDDGRSFYSALGHTAESYGEPGIRRVIAGGIAWVMGEGDCPGAR